MAWYFQWSDALKKRACRYLLQRYLGQYLQEKLTLDQLSVDLYNGTGTISDVNLDVEGLNEMADTYSLPFEFVDGYIRSISVSIPWSALLKDSSFVEVEGLMATIQPKQRVGSVSLVNSMWGSMTTSMQLAEECLRHDENYDKDSEPAKPFEGLERFAQTIESVLCRIKVRFVDTVFRLEHVPKGSHIGVALEVRIKKVDFFDEAGTESSLASEMESRRNVHEPAAFTCKNFCLEGITIYTDEFPSKARTFSKSISSLNSSPETKIVEAYSTAPETPEPAAPQQHLHSVFESCFVDPEQAEACCAQSEPILAAQLSGRHEIRLRVKQCDGISGPKVSVDCSVGAVVVFASPRQVHVVLELCSGILSPDLEDDSNVARRYAVADKPMQASDFDRVEQELQRHLKPRVPGRSLLHPHQGWSSQSLEDSDDEFHPFDGSTSTRMTLSALSSASSQFSDGSDSTTSSIARPSPPARTTARRLPPSSSHHHHGLNEDSLAETTYLKVQLSSVVALVLHDNVLTPTAHRGGGGLATRSSVQQMKAKSEAFFAELGIVVVVGRDLAPVHARLSAACQANHLRLVAAPLTLEGSGRTSATASNISVSASMGTVELVECLFDRKSFSSQSVCPEYSTLLSFAPEAQDGRSGGGGEKFYSSVFAGVSFTEPCVRIKVNHWERLATNGNKMRRTSGATTPRTDVTVGLTSCHSELDISIVDRISSLLDMGELRGWMNGGAASASSSSVLKTGSQAYLSQAVMDEAAGSAGGGHGRKIDVAVAASKATLAVRFPIPDLRPLHDMDRMPWWKRAVRGDILTLELVDARLRTSTCDSDLCWAFDLRCRELNGFFQESVVDPPISFLHVSSGLAGDVQADDGLDWPRIHVRLHPPTPALALEEQEERHRRHHQQRQEEDSDDPMNGSSTLDTLVHDLCSSDGGEPSPFSARKVIYKSEHAGDPPDNNNGRKRTTTNADGEQMVLPGERGEAAEFVERSARNSQYVVEVNFANLNVLLPNKHFYEVLYNRVTTDLMLWQCAAPRPASKDPAGGQRLPPPPPLSHDWANTCVQDTIYQTFSLCRSALRCDSSSDSGDDEEEDETPTFASFREHKERNSMKRPAAAASGRSFCGQNRVCFLLTCKQGAVTLRTPLRDSMDKVIPEHHGEIQLQVSEASFFAVATASAASPTVCLMGFHANRASVYHNGVLASGGCGFVDDLLTSRVGPAVVASPPGHLFPTLYHSEEGTDGDDDMVLVAVRVDLDSVRRVKTFRVALAMRGATLRHRVAPPPESCFGQFVDFFNVLDYPVMGYRPPDVITELHLHAWGCAVDYRPLHLPVRAVVTVEAFTICSNIAAQTSASVVRVILEDACLFLSKAPEATDGVVDLKKDYVCVVDVGFFELSVRLSDAKDQRQPKVDLRASNNLINIRTCTDSCRALQDLMAYLAGDGDLLRDASECCPTAPPTSSYFGEEGGPSTLTNVEAEQVNSLMAEAMKESATNSRASSESENVAAAANAELLSNGDVFLFPDETTRHPRVIVAVAKGRGDDERNSSPSSDSLDDDFCILENDPGVGIVSRSGKPQVKVLCPAVMVENHFAVPLGRLDQLKAPKHFPTPVLRYALREISLVWHLYGGSDFGPATDDRGGGKKPSCKQAEARPRPNDGVSFSKSSPDEVRWRRASSTSPCHGAAADVGSGSPWWAVGGPGRRHDVLMELRMNKIRFQHEKYPETSAQASRQVLLIHDVEIRDRLASSQMNKFLYLYSSESMPRQSHANMVVVKALHLRPDATGSSQECALKVSLLPLRLNVDQDALLFLYDFFGKLSAPDGDGAAAVVAAEEHVVASNSPSKASHQVPVMSVAVPSSPSVTESSPPPPHNLMQLSGESEQPQGRKRTEEAPESLAEASSTPVFFRSFVFAPDVPIRLDYHGKHVDMEQGALAGIVMGLGQLNCSELRLKRLSYRHGLLGVDRLLAYALGEWLHDIRQTQLPSVLGGVGPLYSLVQLFQGLRDLFWLPIEQYRKDGRIIRGLQRGANAFTTSTAMAALELANRLVQAVQCTAETAYDVVSPGPSVRSQRLAAGRRPRHKKRPSQPADIREGMANAYQVVREGLGDTARTLVQVASQEHEQKGISGAVGGVLRQIPPTVVKPIILATEATSNVLGGMKHQLAPDVRREAAEKWRADD